MLLRFASPGRRGKLTNETVTSPDKLTPELVAVIKRDCIAVSCVAEAGDNEADIQDNALFYAQKLGLKGAARKLTWASTYAYLVSVREPGVSASDWKSRRQ